MRRTRVKICGVMRPEDAVMAAECGADAVGLILHPPSPRNVSIETAARILAALPPLVTPVGLFVDSTAEQIQSISGRLGLRHVQLHGNESPELIGELHDLVIIKAVRTVAATLAQTLDRYRGSSNVRGIVLETGGTVAPGGTGIQNDWNLIREAIDSGMFNGLPRIIAAGGLNPRNVSEVIRSIHPWAVDVSSGVEHVRGEKSASLINAFVEAVAQADSLRLC